mmetsp:Transcript_115902/g.368535  ORF Transcript_115902/g.368535 Transcript_115902/m.368535 type:complete len:240 (-) Transcript_115902:684-1403(-)
MRFSAHEVHPTADRGQQRPRDDQIHWPQKVTQCRTAVDLNARRCIPEVGVSEPASPVLQAVIDFPRLSVPRGDPKAADGHDRHGEHHERPCHRAAQQRQPAPAAAPASRLRRPDGRGSAVLAFEARHAELGGPSCFHVFRKDMHPPALVATVTSAGLEVPADVAPRLGWPLRKLPNNGRIRLLRRRCGRRLNASRTLPGRRLWCRLQLRGALRLRSRLEICSILRLQQRCLPGQEPQTS